MQHSKAFVIIDCHRNSFLHAARSESARSASRHGTGKKKDNREGKVLGSKGNPVLHQQLWREREKTIPGFADFEKANCS